MWTHLLVTLALAQTFDGSGATTAPLRTDLADPIFGHGGARWSPAGGAVLGQAVSNPLVRELRDGDSVTFDPILGSMIGMEFSGYGPLSRRVDLAISAPVWVTADGTSTGPAIGDLHTFVPVRVLSTIPLELAAIPFLRLPTGADQRYLGDPIGGGLLASAGTRRGMWFAHMDLGFDVGGATQNPDWPGSVRAGVAGRSCKPWTGRSIATIAWYRADKA